MQWGGHFGKERCDGRAGRRSFEAKVQFPQLKDFRFAVARVHGFRVGRLCLSTLPRKPNVKDWQPMNHCPLLRALGSPRIKGGGAWPKIVVPLARVSAKKG